MSTTNDSTPIDHGAALALAAEIVAHVDQYPQRSEASSHAAILARAYLDITSRSGRSGPKAAAARTEDGRLVVKAIDALSATTGQRRNAADVARAIKVSPALLSQCNARKNPKKLSAEVVGELEGLILDKKLKNQQVSAVEKPAKQSRAERKAREAVDCAMRDGFDDGAFFTAGDMAESTGIKVDRIYPVLDELEHEDVIVKAGHVAGKQRYRAV